MYNNYLKKLLIFICLMALPIFSNWLFLFNCGELTPIEKIAKQQLSNKDGCIVGLATRNQGYYYKKALFQESKPQLLTLGSSRVMQFQKSFFSTSMINAGGAMSSVNQGLSFLKETLNENSPDAIIIGLDYWWFNANSIEPVIDVTAPRKLSHAISLRSYLLPYKWLLKKKITFKQYFERVNPFFLFLAEKDQNIGVDGIFYNNGFAEDGSHIYAKVASGIEKNVDDQFALSLTDITRNGPHFEYGKEIDPIHFNQFMQILDLLKQKQIKVFLFIAPVAPKVAQKMDEYNEEYQFIVDLRKKLTAAGIEFSDFHHPKMLATTDCEFVDGIHGGDLVYAKILKSMALKHQDLRPYLNHAYLDTVTHYYQNIALIPRGSQIKSEIDFLHLGCEKSAQFAQLPTNEMA